MFQERTDRMELDPYRKWLGIPPEQQPPDHYTLLGIARFETDEEVIENAAVRQMAHVRTFQGGQHSALSQQLLNELSSARLCLLKDDEKQAYDQQLRNLLAAVEPLTETVAQVTPIAPLPVAEQVNSASPGPVKTGRRSRRRRQRRHAEETRLAWTIILFVIAALLVCVCIGIAIARRGTSSNELDGDPVLVSFPSMVNSRCLNSEC